jgi:uncharacterized DUF497 family protein
MKDALFEYDSEKDAANQRKHGLSLEVARRIDWNNIRVVPDTRHDYQEARYQIYGKVLDRLHVLIVTPRDGVLRVISLRKANRREVNQYG